MRDTIPVLGVKIDKITTKEVETRLEEFLISHHKAILTTPNTELITKAQRDSDLLRILNDKSKMNLPDSYGVLWAARFLTTKYPANFLGYILIPVWWCLSLLLLPLYTRFFHKPIPEKISGSDFVWTICKIAAKTKSKVFLFGGGPTVAERAALRLQTDIPDLRVAGVFSGDATRETPRAIEIINRSRADILLLCLGAPQQEFWLDENLSKICCKIGVGLGGTFDFIARVTPRAPLWMQRSGLEWLFRLMIDPRRLRRQLALPKFALMILKERLK